MSTKFVLSNIVRLKTRFLYRAIDCQLSWDSLIKILDYPEALKEIVFWKYNIVRLNKRNVSTMGRVNYFIFSDASYNALGVVVSNNQVMCHKNFSPFKKIKSSTWRELEGIRFSLISFKEILKRSSVVWKTDNKAASLIVDSGSKKLDLHDIGCLLYTSPSPRDRG